MKYSKEDKSHMYQDYKRGFCVGASGQSKASQIGTQAPVFEDEFDKGWEDGARLFTESMMNAHKRIQALPEHD